MTTLLACSALTKFHQSEDQLVLRDFSIFCKKSMQTKSNKMPARFLSLQLVKFLLKPN